VSVAPPEYVIIRKLEFFREGGSEKHMRNVRAMVAVSGTDLNRKELEEWIDRRGLQTEWKIATHRIDDSRQESRWRRAKEGSTGCAPAFHDRRNDWHISL